MTYAQKYFIKLLISNSFGRLFKTSGSRILMYHSIDQWIPEDKYNIYNLRSELFNEQIIFLKETKFNDHLQTIDNVLNSKNSLHITFDDGCKSILYKASPILTKYKVPFTVYISPKLIMQDNEIYLNNRELLELSKNKLCTLGTHGYSHLPLTSLNEREVKNEILNSKKWLEDKLGKVILHMSYPHGAYNKQIMQIVEDCGFKSAATSNAGSNSQPQDSFALCRTSILSHDTISHFSSKLKGNWDWTRLIPT